MAFQVHIEERPSHLHFTVTGDNVGGLRDLLSGRTQSGNSVSLPAYGALILEPAGRGTRRSSR